MFLDQEKQFAIINFPASSPAHEESMPKGTLLIRALPFAALLLTCQLADAQNWPRFRGPNGTGIAHDRDIPIRFDAKDGILWKVPAGGLGNSSPVVWDNHLFLQSSTPDGKQRLLVCFDATTGKRLWTRTASGVTAHTHELNTLASSTPATDGQIVVTAFWDGKGITLAAYDFSGKPRWESNLGAFKGQHGPGASPIFFGDKVFFADDQDGVATLYALDKKTGEVAWKASREAYRACYSAPFILEKPGAAPELIVVSTTSVRSYEPDTGSVNWNWHWKFTGKMPLRTTGSPIYANDMIFACSGDGYGPRHMMAVKLHGSGTQARPELAWENKKDFPYVPCLLSRGEHLYFVNDRGFAGCFVAETGKQVWLKRLAEDKFISSPVLIDGKIYAASVDGDVYVLAAEPKYQLLGKSSLGERFRASPAVANNRLYLRGENHLFCIGKK
jgi:outer membrane protein assembly factor BamB